MYDKSGLIELGTGLANMGWELVASGGTAAMLREAGLAVVDVAAITGAPEMLGGRVKTLHPAVHGGILARDTAGDRADLAAQKIGFIDLVVCNLYPFAETVAKPGVTVAAAIEQIDIGGVTLLRAAAKNFARVAVVCDPADYDEVLADLEAGALHEKKRQRLALKAFTHTRDYDTAIVAYLQGIAQDETQETAELPPYHNPNLVQIQTLRYGENPHQKAALYATSAEAGPLGGQLLQGKSLSYNNLLDLDAAWRAVEAFDEGAVVIVKHLSPCGIAAAPTPAAAFPLALASDPVSAFGGVIAVNGTADMAFANAVAETGLFVEAVIARGFSEEAQAWFAEKKKNCRLVLITEPDYTRLEMRAVRGGALVQESDTGDPAGIEWRVVSERQPTEAEWAAMRFNWKAAQHVKSNAIVFGRENCTVGIGGGLPSRVDAVKLAATKAGERAKGAIMASDAFFPFPDGIEVAAAAGVTAVVQPGGSIRDDVVIEAVNKVGLAMVFTGTRHFRH